MSKAPFSFDLFDRSWWSDPYPLYRRILDEAPTGRIGELGACYVAGFDQCEQILRDSRFGVGRVPVDGDVPGSSPGRSPVFGASFLFLDPPDHTRLRGFVARAFTPRVVADLETWIGQVVDSLLDAIPPDEPFDLVDALAYPLPVAVICELLGVPLRDRDLFAAWSKELVATLDPELVVCPAELERRRLAADDLSAYMAGLVSARRKSPRQDLLTTLTGSLWAGPGTPTKEALESSGALTEDELVATLVLLLVAGYETTVNLLGNAVLALARHPDQAGLLERDPSLIPGCVEEVLRFDPPVQITSRTAFEDVVVDGLEVGTGNLVVVFLAAGNRDGRVFPDPDVFEVRRQVRRHLSFGLGAHHCIGASLARREVVVALRRLLAHQPRPCLAGAPSYRDTFVLRGIDALPIGPLSRR